MKHQIWNITYSSDNNRNYSKNKELTLGEFSYLLLQHFYERNAMKRDIGFLQTNPTEFRIKSFAKKLVTDIARNISWNGSGWVMSSRGLTADVSDLFWNGDHVKAKVVWNAVRQDGWTTWERWLAVVGCRQHKTGTVGVLNSLGKLISSMGCVWRDMIIMWQTITLSEFTTGTNQNV